MITLRSPRKMLRGYSKCIFGYILELELKLNLLTESNEEITTIYKSYLNSGLREYYELN